ncbi:MAG: hypothetical protein EOO71_06135 [Myxococcaceae bacterium]|nr:MAG: hypothetical protein EOO71_06135 [Myxococcaceae bacterium]
MAGFLTALPGVDPSFVRWFRPGRSRKDALKSPIEPSPKELEKLIARGRDRVFADLGFRVSGWNGVADDHDATGFDIQCGSHTDVVGNTCVFALPGMGPNTERILSASVLTAMLRETAIAWAPDWGVAMSHAHRDLVEPHRAQRAPYVGWVTYLAGTRGTVPPLPAPVRVEHVQDQGSLIVLMPERFTASNPEHLALAKRVHELLERAELLKPGSLLP